MKDPSCRVAPERGGPSRKRRPSPSSGTATETPARPRRPKISRISLKQYRRAAAEQERHPCNGAPPTGGVAASRAMTRLSRHRRSAASRCECASDARTTRREARVPAGQYKKAAPSGARSAGQSASSESPAHFPTLPIVTRRAKTTGLVRAANRAGCRKAAPNRTSVMLTCDHIRQILRRRFNS